MANPDWGELLTSTLIHHRKQMTDNFFLQNFWWDKLGSRRRTDGGESIKEELRYAGNPHGGYYKGFDPLPTSPFQNLTSIQNPWIQHSAPVAISGFEEAVNAGAHRVIGLLENKLETTEMSIQDTFNFDAINGDGSNPLALHGAQLQISNVPYGGIDPAAANGGFWLPTVYHDGTSTDVLDFSVLTKDIKDIRDTKNDIDAIMLAGDLWLGLIQEANDQGATFGLRQDTREASLGFDTVKYMGVSIGYDNMIPAGTAYLMTMDKMTLWACGDRFMRVGPFREPHNQDARVAHFLSQIQLTVRERRAMGKRFNMVPYTTPTP